MDVTKIVKDRWSLDALAVNLGVSTKVAKNRAKAAGLIVERNCAGNWFVSTKDYERKHPLRPNGCAA